MARIIYFTFVLIFSLTLSYGQDSCDSAINITGQSGDCFTLDFTNASYDILNGVCADSTQVPNLWYKFRPEGPDLILTNQNPSVDINFSLIRFTSGLCDPTKYSLDTCAKNSLVLTDYLDVNSDYYIEINQDDSLGIAQYCFMQPDTTPAPTNDLICGAIEILPDGSCTEGTTVYAEDDITVLNCDGMEMQSVWYKFTVSEGNYFASQISIENISVTGDIQVILGQVQDSCSGEFSFQKKYCGPPEGIAIDHNEMIMGETYYINVATLHENAGNFNICVQEFESAPNINPCEAEVITLNESCTYFDTYYSNFQNDLVPCDYSNHTLWFLVEEDDNIKDIRFTLDRISGSESIFMGVGLFMGNWCENDFEFIDTYCGDVIDAEVFLDQPIDFRSYYVVIGSTYGFTGEYLLCTEADYKSPFINDAPCQAYELDSITSCISGSNMYGRYSSETLCDSTPAYENWYKFETQQLGHSINVDFQSSSSHDVKIQLGYFLEGCNDDFQILSDYCGASGDSIISYQLSDSLSMAYLRVLTDTSQISNFNICLNKNDYGYQCYENDFCHDALDIGTIHMDTDECFVACTFGTTPEDSQNLLMNQYPTTWYSFTNSNVVDIIQLNAYSSTSLGVQFMLFDSCNAEIPIFQSYEQIVDTITLNLKLDKESTYYLAVTPLAMRGGKLDICLKGELSNFCNKKEKLEVTSTSLGSPLNGPYRSGEILNICYTLEAYNPMDLSNCQWVQGIVPFFSDAWSDESFNVDGRPAIVTDSIEAISSTASWEWRGDAVASSLIPNRYITFRNSDNLFDFCYGTLSECSGTAVSEGVPLPVGWYSTNSSGGGTMPNNSYGDGIHCDQDNGEWTVCFDLKIGESNEPLDIEIYTLADGEIGEGSNSSSVCNNDQPLKKRFYQLCQDSTIYSSVTYEVCSGHKLILGDVEQYTYKWMTMRNDDVLGINSGGGSSCVMEWHNISNEVQEVNIFIQIFDGFCLIEEKAVLVKLYPQPDLPDIELTTVCLFDTISMAEIIDLENLIYEPFTVEWATVNLLDEPDALWSETQDETFMMNIITQSGCIHTDEVNIHVEDVDVAEYVSPFTICRDEEFNMTEIINLDSLITDEFSVMWNDPNIQDTFNANTSFQESSTILMSIVGKSGCTFTDSIDITVPAIDISLLGDSHYCSSEDISLTAGYIYDLPHNRYWIAPNQDTIHFTGIVFPATTFGAGDHVFTFEVETEENCFFQKSDTIHVDWKPILSVNQDTSHLDICPGDSIQLAALASPTFNEVFWSRNGMHIDSSSFWTDIPGTYQVYAGLEHCRTSDTFELVINPAVNTTFSYEDALCAGDTTVIQSLDDQFIFEWSTGEESSAIQATGGSYDVTVTNDNSCTEQYHFNIIEKDLPEPSFEYPTNLCATDTSIITADTDTLSYLWSTGEMSSSILITYGVYNVTFSDNMGCSDSMTFDISENPAPNVLVETDYVDSTLMIYSSVTDADSCYLTVNNEYVPYSDSIWLQVNDNKWYEVELNCENEDCYAMDTSSIFIPTIVGNSNIQNTNIRLYPNPASSFLHIDNPKQETWESISFYNIKGEREIVFYAFSDLLDITSLNRGIYFVKIQFRTKVSYFKIIIQ